MSTPGEQLRAAREARKLSIAQVVKAIRIRGYYLEAMEADDLSIMPSAVQARGFLRAYAEFLGLDFGSLANPGQATQQQALPVVDSTLPVPEPEPEPQPEPENSPKTNSSLPAETLPEEPEVLETTDPQPSDLIFRQIGSSLRQRRELLGLTLEEIERHTRVRKNNLQIIEQGDFDSLPSPVQARGMLNTYANFLDMNGEAMLLRFAEGLQARRLERQPDLAAKSAGARRRWTLPLWMRRLVSPDLIFGTIMIVGISLLVLWGATRIITTQEIEEEDQAPSISDVLLSTPDDETATPLGLPTSVDELGTPLPSLDDEPTQLVELTAPLPGTLLQVTLIVRERVFIRVTVDGEVVQEGRVAPGAALVFDGSERIEVLTGNGGAVQVIYNQFDFGVMSNPGQVANRIYTIDGVQTPTPTISPTPTNTPRVQPSATPTVTPTLSPTGNP